MKKTKKSLVLSIVTLLLCSAMFVGSTFAWFTDTVSNTGNRIQAGTLDVGLYKLVKEGDEYSWKDLETSETNNLKVFDSGFDDEGNTIALWEPGYSQYAVLKVSNEESNLALKYKLNILKNASANVNNPNAKPIEEVIDVYAAIISKDAAESITPDNAKSTYMVETNKLPGTLRNYMILDDDQDDQDGAARGILIPAASYDESKLTDAEKALIPADKEDAYAIVILHMQETAGNDYQNTQAVFDIRLDATQYTYEKDGFDSNEYDNDAQYKEKEESEPTVSEIEAMITDNTKENTVVADFNPALGFKSIEVKIPAGTFDKPVKMITKSEDDGSWGECLSLIFIDPNDPVDEDGDPKPVNPKVLPEVTKIVTKEPFVGENYPKYYVEVEFDPEGDNYNPMLIWQMAAMMASSVVSPE